MGFAPSSSSSYSLIIFIFTLTTTPLLYCTLASSETNFQQNPNLKTGSKADDGSSGVENVWCVAKNNADDTSLQGAIDWACGQGGADCRPIQTNGPCYDPNNIQSTATFVFNDYYLRNGRTDESCNFSGTAALSSLDPSHGNCKITSSRMNVANGSFVATGNNDTSGVGNFAGGLVVPITTIILFTVAWFVLLLERHT